MKEENESILFPIVARVQHPKATGKKALGDENHRKVCPEKIYSRIEEE